MTGTVRLILFVLVAWLAVAFPARAQSSLASRVLAGGIPQTSLTLNPQLVVGPSPASGTIILPAAAPSGATVVNLKSSKTSVATVPANVTIPAGATQANFKIDTASVSSSTPVTITASLNAMTKEPVLQVKP